MSKNISSKDLWRWASVGALALAAISSAYLFITYALTSGSTVVTILKSILEVAKIVGCILVMRWFMRRFKEDWPDAQKSDIRGLGTAMALLSAVLFAGVSMAVFLANPDLVSQAIDAAMSAYSSQLDHNSRTLLESLPGKMPAIAFFSNLIYCFLYGWILSAILAPGVCTDNPFGTDKDDDEEEDED